MIGTVAALTGVLAEQRALRQGRKLWLNMLYADTVPAMTTARPSLPTCNFRLSGTGSSRTSQESTIPCQQILFAQTEAAPKWSHIEWAQQVLLHAYTLTGAEHAAPALTAIGYINWWEGRGSKAHQFLQLALDTDPPTDSPDSATK
ncbi:hypothetical protein DXK94_07820 [Arthrobacter sp. RT-1]|nr:hypothetical protein DXK94_07820 [Arthrobacter sp. RT-1]